MRNTRWLRYGLGTIIVAGTALSGLLVACGDDDVGSSSGSTPDTGTTDTGTTDTGATDSGGDTGTDAGTLAKLTLVNATTDMGPNAGIGGNNGFIRVCFKQGTNAGNIGVAPYPPLPDKPAQVGLPPGIPQGTGGSFPSFGLDLSTRIIVPIIMNAKNLFAKGIVNPGTGSPGTTCDELVGATADANAGLVAGVDYWELPQIDAGTFQKEKSYLLLLTGCVGDATLTNKDKCGAENIANVNGTPGVGNLKVRIMETNRTPVSATALGVQFVHASAQASAIFSPVLGPNVSPGFASDPMDAGSFRQVVPDGGVAYAAAPTPAVGVTGVIDSHYFALGSTNPLPPPAVLLPYPLPAIQAFSGLGTATAPTVYKDGKNFVFIAVGDPDQANEPVYTFPDGGIGDGGDGSKFNTRFFHFLAFPTDPDVAAYKP